MSHQQLPRDVSASAKQQASGRQGRGARLRHIVEVALMRRRLLVVRCLCRTPDAAMEASRGRLQVWLERNPFPSDATVKAFPLMADLQLVMPHNPEGKKLLIELHHVVHAH